MTTSSSYTPPKLAYASCWARTLHRRNIPMTPKIVINMIFISPNHSQNSIYNQRSSSWDQLVFWPHRKSRNVQTPLFPIPSHSDLSHSVMLQNECTIETGQWNYTYVTTGMTTIQIPFTAHSACVVSTISPATGNAEQRFKLRSFQGLDDYSSCNTLHILTFACIYFQIVT